MPIKFFRYCSFGTLISDIPPASLRLANFVSLKLAGIRNRCGAVGLCDHALNLSMVLQPLSAIESHINFEYEKANRT